MTHMSSRAAGVAGLAFATVALAAAPAGARTRSFVAVTRSRRCRRTRTRSRPSACTASRLTAAPARQITGPGLAGGGFYDAQGSCSKQRAD
jgi:hypothetical protein